MILVDSKIHAYNRLGKISISPFDPSSINPNSYDLKLSKSFQVSRETAGIDPLNEKSIRFAFQEVKSDEIWLESGGFILAETREMICLPANIVGILNGKSSLARLGIEIHCTGGFVDAGFCGTITLEITNKHPSPVKLYAGMRIAQLVFVKTEKSAIPYGNRQESKYMNQSGATVSRYHLNRVDV